MAREVNDPTTDAPTRVVRAGDVAVLARTNKHCADIASALKQRGIRDLVGESGLLGTPEAC